MNKPKLNYWAYIPPMPAEEIARAVRDYESAGLEGIWISQTFGAPFGPLCAAAASSSKLKLGAGIALAFTRSPLETACNAMDLDLISNGRAVLGLGSSARDQIEDRYGINYGKPLAHMREVVSLVRTFIARAHLGELGKIEGEYYNLNMTGFRTLEPPVRTEIPIFLPGIFEKAIEQAGTIADGLIAHPLWTERWINDKIEPSLARGLDASGRTLASFEVNLCPFIMISDNRREAIEDARATVAFYTQSPHYNAYFDYIGFGQEARAIQEAHSRGDFAGMTAACPDEMVETIVLVGSADEVLKRLADQARFSRSCTPKAAHVSLSADKVAHYTKKIADLFYG